MTSTVTSLAGTSPPANSRAQAALEAAARQLLDYCREQNWSGYDPYDALNSRVFRALPFLDFKLARLALIQTLKRSPVNLRPLLLVPRTQNPKALALFLSASLKLSRLGLLRETHLARTMVEGLEALRAPNTSYWCWGYNFPWQTRTVLVPRGAPNLVSTTFVANALLDLYEECHDSRLLQMAASAADYLINELYWTDTGSVAGFAYPVPSARYQVHNANLLGSALLCRVAACSGDPRFLAPALKVARYSASRQMDDGSWLYGEAPNQQWIDNFHTGYNLCALRRIAQFTPSDEFDQCLLRGFRFYRGHFFEPDGAPRYFHDRQFPAEIHSAAQSVITLLEFKDEDDTSVLLAQRVLEWALAHLRAPQGYFYYQQLSYGTVKIPYMRWSQAWMALALSTFLEEQRLPVSTQPLLRSSSSRAFDLETVSSATETEPAPLLRYVLITPARNEADFIGLTLASVVAQTVRPLKWLIVSDGSTDGTDDIVARYAREHPWIELLRMPARTDRNFAGKVRAFNAGYERVKSLRYDFLASLDGDLSFEPDYFAFLLSRLAVDPKLGLVGTPFCEEGRTYDYRFTSIEHVSGACQVFRRQCFEDIGGYVPVKGGGIDLIAVLTARMKGWQTRTFLEKSSVHHRKQGSANHSSLSAWFNVGRKDYALGGHPLWEIFRWLYQMTRSPFVLGGCWLMAGYVSSMLARRDRPVSREIMAFRRREQMVRLKRFLFRRPASGTLSTPSSP